METTDTLLQLLQEAHKTNQTQQQTIQNLTTEIQLLNEKVNYLTNKLFGRSKETLFEETNGQLNLFSDEEISVSVPEAAATIIPVKGHQRVVGTKTDKIKHLPITEKEHLLPLEEQFCEHCGSQMKDIGRTKVREEIRFHQAMLDCLTHYQHTYCCKSCEKEGLSSFKKAIVPKPLISNSLGSNSLVAETIRMKFGQKVPAYRQENYWKQTHGLDISRDNITNWHIKAVQNALDPLGERLRVYLNQEEILHGDETSYRVIESAKTDTYYWQFCTGKDSQHPIVYYHHDESRAGDVPKTFLKEFTGYLHCDGYSGYNAVESVRLVYCFAHVRRKFFEAIPKGKKNTDIPAAQAVKQLDKWFVLEKKWKDFSPEKRLSCRQQELRPLFIAFYEWMATIDPVAKSKLDAAVQYACKLRSGFEPIFEDGRLELTNNRAERNIKELVIGRKNWLHSTSLEGARTSGIILSVYKTAELNGLNPVKYLEFLFDKIPNLPVLSAETLDQLLPWNKDVQQHFSR
ncbi:TPA: IS66 family transposase, partial [Enterococcus faecium]